MKYFPYIILVFIIGISIVIFQFNIDTCRACEYEYLRIHILANSNSEEDQEIKSEVKTKIVDFLTPYLEEVQDKEEAKQVVNENISIIKSIVDNTLEINELKYESSCVLTVEHFPTRYYENTTLEEGDYDALVITLGDGKGDNWWCVVYPPLCFVNKNQNQEQNIVYNSRFLEIIENFFD